MQLWSKKVVDTGEHQQSNVSARYKSMKPPRVPVPTTTSYLTISPGISPTMLLESPVLLNAGLDDPSPRTGSFSVELNSLISGMGFQPPDDYTASAMEFKSDEPSSFSCASLKPNEIMDSAGHHAKPSENPLVEFKSDEPSSFSCASLKPNEIMDSAGHHAKPSENPLAAYVRDVDSVSSCLVERTSEDGYNWKKYGQKQLKGMAYPRSYYKCTHPNCPVKKQVENSSEGGITEILYKGEHIHPKPEGGRRGARNCAHGWKPAIRPHSLTHDVSIDAERMDASGFSREATPEPSFGSPTFEECADSEGRNADGEDEDEQDSKRRRINQDGETLLNAQFRAVREPRVVVQTVSEVDLLDDGYRWRKYGQKVVKGKHFPRSYYKCTNMGCPVRKNIERSSSDPKSVVTAYEGKHNHSVPLAGGGIRDTNTTPVAAARSLPMSPTSYSAASRMCAPLPSLQSEELCPFVGARSNGENGAPVSLSGAGSLDFDENISGQLAWLSSAFTKNWDV